MTELQAPACRECRFWQQFSAVQERGKCRRYAPRPTIPTHDAQSWPETRREDFCGEFAARGAIEANFKCARCGSEVFYQLARQREQEKRP